MAAVYNLRSLQKKKYNASGNRCYLKNYLKNRSPETLNPKVCLERLKLDSNNIHNYRFYLNKDKITIMQDRPIITYKKCFFIFCLIILLTLCLIYFKDEVQLYGINIAKNFGQFYPAIQSFYFHAVKVPKSYLKSFAHKVQNISNDNGKSEVLQDFVLKSTDNDFEILKMVRVNFLKVKKTNKFKNPITTAESFIEKQCKAGIKDNLTTFFDESNITDYALESLGAEIVATFNTEPYGIKTVKFLNFNIWPSLGSYLMKSSKYFSTNGPNSVLVVSGPNTVVSFFHFISIGGACISVQKEPWKKPGDCWAFKGSHGSVLIKLSEKIFVTAITVDHIPKKSTFDGSIRSAPKKFSVIGVEEPGVSKGGEYLGTYEYKIDGAASQTFLVQTKDKKIPFSGIEVSIESNHGNENYTCVYKIRVHGHK